MIVSIIREDKPYRLVTDGGGHYAVIEARCGHVYSLVSDQDHHRREAPDTPAGMASVVGDGWGDYDHALLRFQSMVESEERYSQIIW